MMKNKKFRVWDNDNEVMEYFNFSNLSDVVETLDSYRSYFSDSYFDVEDEDTEHKYNPLMMALDKLDLNGKEIYAGDIVAVFVLSTKESDVISHNDEEIFLSEPKDDYVFGVVTYRDCAFYVVISGEGEDDDVEAGFIVDSTVAVMGNVFENADLLD